MAPHSGIFSWAEEPARLLSMRLQRAFRCHFQFHLSTPVLSLPGELVKGARKMLGGIPAALCLLGGGICHWGSAIQPLVSVGLC